MGGGLGLGLNLAALKQAKGVQDFQDEFMARADEYSQSWRDALKREKRFWGAPLIGEDYNFFLFKKSYISNI